MEWPFFDPLIKCGQQSLRVFCVGVVLSFLGTIFVQFVISLAGIGILCAVAYYGDWSKTVDRLIKRPPRVDQTGGR